MSPRARSPTHLPMSTPRRCEQHSRGPPKAPRVRPARSTSTPRVTGCRPPTPSGPYASEARARGGRRPEHGPPLPIPPHPAACARRTARRDNGRGGLRLPVEAAALERVLYLALAGHVLVVQLFGRLHDAAHLELAHDVHLAQGLVHVVGPVAGGD